MFLRNKSDFLEFVVFQFRTAVRAAVWPHAALTENPAWHRSKATLRRRSRSHQHSFPIGRAGEAVGKAAKRV